MRERKGGRSEDLKVFEQLFGASLQLLNALAALLNT